MSDSSAQNVRLSAGLVAAVLVFLVTRVYLVLGFHAWYSDVYYYYKFAVATCDLGGVPYRDVKIEYPPLAFEVMALPRLLATQRVTPQAIERGGWDVALPAYERVFQSLMAAFEAGGFALLLLAVARMRPERVTAAAWVYVLCSTLLAHVLYTRLDAALMFFFMLWAWSWTRADSSRSTFVPALACLALGLGVSYKLVPVVMAPFVLLAPWTGKLVSTELRHVARQTLWSVAGLILPCLPLVPKVGRDLTGWLAYHTERGLEIESVYASIMMVASAFGLPIKAVHGHGSWNLDSSWAPTLLAISTPLVAAVLVCLWLRAVLGGGLGDRRRAMHYAILAVLVTVLLSKVFSPQYLVWTLPLTLLLASDVLTRREFWLAAIAGVLIAALSSIVFPYLFFPKFDAAPGVVYRNSYPLIPSLHPLPVALLVTRNILYGVLVADLIVRVCRQQRPSV